MNQYLNKINALPLEEREFFMSDVPMLEIKKAFVLCGMDSSLSGSIAKEVGLAFVDPLMLKKLPDIIIQNLNFKKEVAYSIAFEINKRIFNKFPGSFQDSEKLLKEWSLFKRTSIISEEEAYKKVTRLEPWILELEKEKEEERKIEEKKENEAEKALQARIASMTISKALEDYPNLGEQPIGSNQIKLKFFPTPVRPSIKNWISDYHDVLGSGKHSPIERGNYLFHSDNGKNLNSTERQKLAAVLKSLDEETELTINTESEQIVFVEEKEDVRVLERGHQSSVARPSDQTLAQRDQEINQRPSNSPINQEIEHPFFAEEKEEEIAAHKISFSPNFAARSSQTFVKENSLPQNFSENFSDKNLPASPSKNFSPNFASNDGMMKFTSPQNLPVEQESKNVVQNNSVEKPQQASQDISRQQKPIVKRNPFHIAPSNVVDLREN